MARFYFHQRIGNLLIEDPDGFDYASLADARASAVVTARHLWAAAIISGDDLSDEAIEVADADGRPVATVLLVDVLPFRLSAACREPSASVVANAA